MILVFNYGGQYAHLIARRVRELGVYSEIVPPEITAVEAAARKPQGIILSGGPASVFGEGAPSIDAAVLRLGVPVLGICYGHQLLCKALGGVVKPGGRKEFGKVELQVGRGSFLLEGILSPQDVWFSHGDFVESLPQGFAAVASTADCANACVEDAGRKLFGVQFHPEVVHTPCGRRVLENFLFKACGCGREWRAGGQVERLVGEIRARVGGEKVLIGISGGVDSLVAATLIRKAVGGSLHCVLVDHGLMRKGEVAEVEGYLREQGFNLVVEDASQDFLSALRGVVDPEEKRRAIGFKFIEVFERAAARLAVEGIRFLAQGTIYPDRIESAQAGKHASKIKSHHNLTLPENMRFQVIEPLKELYKDEVRELGAGLGLPRELLWRHPFPGPGLAIRVLGEVTPEKLAILREADAIFIEELRKAGWYDKVWQAFAALLPVKTVGVMGDSRTYAFIISLRAVGSVDGMTADWSRLPPELLERVSSRIVNEVAGVNRVVFDVTQKPPGTIEYE